MLFHEQTFSVRTNDWYIDPHLYLYLYLYL